MVVKVRVLESNECIELEVKEISVREILSKLGLTLSEHIVLKNGEVITEDDVVEDGSEIVIFTVKSGG
ncbi:MAG: MoaD/ThiS family protein [Desulfurococcaceae archaeon]|jgi:sulfur carrier protein|nr:MoaD/ThiS family protein [Desulfurococcaceae archaeon]